MCYFDDSIRILIKAGADPNIRNNENYTAILKGMIIYFDVTHFNYFLIFKLLKDLPILLLQN